VPSKRLTSQVIAEQTGGRAFFNTNDLGGAIKRAAEDTNLTYVLGYYPENVRWDGRFRDIKVGVTDSSTGAIGTVTIPASRARAAGDR